MHNSHEPALLPLPPIALSEAIRRGAKLAPQAFGMLCDERGNTCTSGAALEGLGLMLVRRTADPIHYTLLPSPFRPWPVIRRYVFCPLCGFADKLGVVMVHLNNSHRTSREDIADFVETYELAELAAECSPTQQTHEEQLV